MRSLLVGCIAAVSLLACDSGSEDQPSRAAQIYLATIRDVVAEQPPPDEPDQLPVVYVVAVGENTIAADVQAEVVGRLQDEVDVTFADERAEALQEDAEGTPVIDDGVLLAVGELMPDVDPVTMPVEVYRSEDDWSRAILTFEERSSRWTITSSSVVPVEGS